MHSYLKCIVCTAQVEMIITHIQKSDLISKPIDFKRGIINFVQSFFQVADNRINPSGVVGGFAADGRTCYLELNNRVYRYPLSIHRSINSCRYQSIPAT
jgi:hypothetical protein